MIGHPYAVVASSSGMVAVRLDQQQEFSHLTPDEAVRLAKDLCVQAGAARHHRSRNYDRTADAAQRGAK